MQTFLPHRDFDLSASVLDRARLGKQRVEVYQLLKALDTSSPRSSWANHPAARMWRGYAPLLAQYGIAICTEWRSRGYQDTCTERILETLAYGTFEQAEDKQPFWLGKKRFHLAHRSNLLRKNPEHYGVYFHTETPRDLEYWWPV